MKRLLALIWALGITLYGCTATPALSSTQSKPTAASTLPTSSLSITATAEPSPSPDATTVSAGEAERTPDPASEMLVTGSVVLVRGDAIQVKADNLNGKTLGITMLNRARFAQGVPKEFAVGNYVRAITSNRLAKTLPEKAAAVMILENSSR